MGEAKRRRWARRDDEVRVALTLRNDVREGDATARTRNIPNAHRRAVENLCYGATSEIPPTTGVRRRETFGAWLDAAPGNQCETRGSDELRHEAHFFGGNGRPRSASEATNFLGATAR